MMKYSVTYKPGTSYHFQGTDSKLYAEMKRSGSHIISGSFGSYVLGTSAYGCITETNTDDNSKRTKYPKQFIRDHYNIKRVTEKYYYMLKNELENGTVQFDDIY